MMIEEVKEILKKRNHKRLLKPHEKTIMSLVPFAETFEEALYCIKEDIDVMPICQYSNCDKKIPHRCYSGLGFYPKGCGEDHTKKLNNLEKYGVENVSQLKVVKKKKEITTLKNYGVKNPKQNKHIATKIKNTMDEKYGGFGKKGVLKEKIENTCLKRFGKTNPMHADHHKNTLIKTLFDKIIKRLENHVKPNFTFEDYQGSCIKQEWECVACLTIFEGSIDNGGIPRCPKCYPNQKISYGEMDLFNAIDVQNKIQNDWSILKDKELDIFIPSKKIAIEFNGIYWHSENQGKKKNYHLDKTKRCAEKGIQLIHVFETEWYYQQEIVKSIINAKLGIFKKRIYARKCQLKKIDSKIKNEFLENNHLQGKDVSSVKFGLYYDGKLVSVMTFGKSRYNNNYQYEMHRFCNKLGYQIIGGASKLLKFFIKEYKPESIITYADRRYSDGSFYEKIGFTNIGVSSPNFFVINKDKLESRLLWQKHKLREKLGENFEPELSAWDNMKLSGYNRIWDCGNHKFEWRK